MKPDIATSAREDFTIEVLAVPDGDLFSRWMWVLWEGPSRRAEERRTSWHGDRADLYVWGDERGWAPTRRLALFFARRAARRRANYRADLRALTVETWKFTMERDES